MKTPVLETRNIFKYFNDPVPTRVLNDISFSVLKGEFVSITGKSGCGKSTLLYILSTMDTEYDGEVMIDNESTTGKTDEELSLIRNKKIGFVFQFHYLINEFNVLKNVMLPGLKYNKMHPQEIESRAIRLLKILDIDKLFSKKVFQLSGGEKQRVAIARALINDPLIIMGDEPTGNLDKKNSDMVFSLFRQISAEMQQSLLIVTHDQGFAAKSDRVVMMEDGKII